MAGHFREMPAGKRCAFRARRCSAHVFLIWLCLVVCLHRTTRFCRQAGRPQMFNLGASTLSLTTLPNRDNLTRVVDLLCLVSHQL